MTDEAAPEGVEIPWERLDPDTLHRLLAEFVTRDGTDYGAVERSIADKIAAVRRQLERGEAAIAFDPVSETTTVVVRRR